MTELNDLLNNDCLQELSGDSSLPSTFSKLITVHGKCTLYVPTVNNLNLEQNYLMSFDGRIEMILGLPTTVLN